ncbi:hypothetical protein KP509_06G045900 [Ceratopteris richardii]|uniref:Translation initiation factor eIF2B subunit beta n=1 Tax=Ceratopteris richardii TaxID=49495 RepID=A0A8T2USB5_CERRI|nr:hypothetical protein KP509_06G045900 [Ceratopteris richardii]
MVAPTLDAQAAVNDFIYKLKRRQVEGSLVTARLTAVLLRQVISQQRLASSAPAATLIETVKSVGLRIIAANPIELTVGNVVRRVLHIIREEEASLELKSLADVNNTILSDDEESEDASSFSAAVVAAANRNVLRAPSLHNLLESLPSSVTATCNASSGGESECKSKSGEKNSKVWRLKHSVIEGINELLQEIDSYHAQVAEQALQHIHHNEVIMTCGRSHAVLQFLLEAKKKRTFEVFVAEGAPRYQGQTLAKELADANLQTTLIADAAVFALISRVNMVVVGAHAVMADGGVMVPVGLHMIALAARRHTIPFVVLAGLHKLCPQYPQNPYIFMNDMKSPSDIIDFSDISDCLDGGIGSPSLQTVNPTFDFVPPDLVSLLITDIGGHTPSYVYRIVAEYYSAEDFVLR